MAHAIADGTKSVDGTFVGTLKAPCLDMFASTVLDAMFNAEQKVCKKKRSESVLSSSTVLQSVQS